MKQKNNFLSSIIGDSLKSQLKFKFISIGSLSIVTTAILIWFVIELGTKTAEYGDEFSYSKLFIVTENTLLYMDKSQNDKVTEKIEKNDIFIYKGTSGKYVTVNPIDKNLSETKKTKRVNAFKDSKNKEIGFIEFQKGYITTPLQYNVNKKFSKDLSNNTYSLGRVLQFFSIRKNIKYVYYLMSVFLLIFNYILYKRLRFLYDSYNDQIDIDEILLEKKNHNKQLNALLDREQNTIPLSFVSALHNSYKSNGSKEQFNNIYSDFLEREGINESSFSQKISLCNVWIIRAGIFGTLIGLIIAFFELYIAVGGIQMGEKLTQDFISQVQQALLGNALSIATSICAHGASLVLEVVIISLISDEGNMSWLQKTYSKMIELKEYKPKVQTPTEALNVMAVSVDEMSTEFDSVTDSLKELSPGAQTTKALIGTMNSALLKINQELDYVNKNLIKAKETTENINVKSSSIDHRVSDTKALIDESHEKMKRLGEESTEFSDYLRTNIKSFQSIASGAIENSQNIIENLNKRLQSLKNSISK